MCTNVCSLGLLDNITLFDALPSLSFRKNCFIIQFRFWKLSQLLRYHFHLNPSMVKRYLIVHRIVVRDIFLVFFYIVESSSIYALLVFLSSPNNSNKRSNRLPIRILLECSKMTILRIFECKCKSNCIFYQKILFICHKLKNL